MKIEDIKIKIKKYDREKNVAIANLIISDVLELRGFTIRYTATKYSEGRSIWIVTPPSIKGSTKSKFTNKFPYFWIAKFIDSDLWAELEKNMIQMAKDYTSLNLI